MQLYVVSYKAVENKNPVADDGLTPQELMWNNVELIRIDQN